MNSQAIQFSIPTRSAFPSPASHPGPFSFNPLPNPAAEFTLLSTAKPPAAVAAHEAAASPAANAVSLGLPERPLPVVGRPRATPRPRSPKSVSSLEETTVKPVSLYTPRPYKVTFSCYQETI